MYSILSLHNWIEAIQSDLEEDLTNTKHFHHIKAVERLINGSCILLLLLFYFCKSMYFI